MTPPLSGISVVSIAVNLPGPAAAHRLQELGADVTKVEPPTGDPLSAASPEYYAELRADQTVVTIDLKTDPGRAELDRLLAAADLLITSSRPSALGKLHLGWDELHTRLPRLSQVAIVGHGGADSGVPGHDLTYQAQAGSLTPPAMPRLLAADLAGAERAVADGLAALVAASRSGEGVYREVALADVAQDLAAPVRYALTTSEGVLGGALPRYSIYRASDGHVAVAALEEHFWQRLVTELGLPGERAALEAAFAQHPAVHWERWAEERGLPITAVRST